MSTETRDLLFEIGCEELPASFVEAALAALPTLAKKRLGALRLGHAAMEALGTPRRLTLLVRAVAAAQDDLEEEVVGPPVKVAWDGAGKPTRAAEAFAKKTGCELSELRRVETPKGEYVAATRTETGRAAAELLPEALAALAQDLPFRKSMRWGTGKLTFGRPVRWLLALFGTELLDVTLGPVRSGRVSYGHRFLHPGPVEVASPSAYVSDLAQAHVLVDPAARQARMQERLLAAAEEARGSLIEDAFLVGENLSLVEEPHVIVGSFEEQYLELPECVVLEVARGHQRYFCLRGPDGRLQPKYLAVANTAERPETIRLGNDRVMRARLADAQFFHREDSKQPLAKRRAELGGIVFQRQLGSVLDKVARCESLTRSLGSLLGLPEPEVEVAVQGAGLAKCDLVTLMVGEFPELQGEVGREIALAQGVEQGVADAIRSHYQPKGAKDDTAPDGAGALVAIADRLDTLVGCFGIGLSPTGAADPYGLRRACIGSLRTVLDRRFDLVLSSALRAAHQQYTDVELSVAPDELVAKLGGYFRERLRGILADSLPADAVDAALGVAADRPLDARARAEAIADLDASTRAQVGELFKRATNIAKDAPEGEPQPPAEVVGEVHPSEQALADGFLAVRGKLGELRDQGAYPDAFGVLAEFTPVLGRYFDDVFVMDDDPAVRDNRLRLMRAISDTCGTIARLELLGPSRE